MNVDRIRLHLTLAYVGIFALILLFLGFVSVLGFTRALTNQQDDLLLQEARNTTQNLLEENEREVLATNSDEFGWIALEPDGDVMDRNWTTSTLGLPSDALFEETLREEEVVAATIQGTNGRARAVSMPMYESGEMIGVMQYARSLRGVQRTVDELVFVLLPLGLGALGLAAIGGTYMAGRAVRPVRESFERQRAFIADASHELKTPLTLIRADTEVIQRGLKEPDDKELADDVLSEADRMNSVLSDLLLVARLDADKLPVEQEDFDLVAVTSDATERFRKRASSAGVQLEIEAPAELPARGDAARTEQILAVLLDNAFSHAPEGDSITVEAHVRNGFVEAVVRDTGPGIPSEHLPHIFERFYRADKARSRASRGTGLGLCIARDLARAQKGDLTAENVEAGGAVFRLKLPAG